MKKSFFCVIALGAQLMCTSSLCAQQKTVIKLEGANALKNLKVDGRNLIRCIGNVRFLYDNTRMACDSAYLDSEDNSFDAYGNVVITKESTRITGDILHFDGKTSLGKLTGDEVRMVDADGTTLITNILFFNSKTNYGYYTTGGVITSKESRLVSKRGYYNRETSTFSFAENVEMYHPDGKVFSDSIEYGSKSEIASFFGPTYIYNKENFAYCEKGWYDKIHQKSNLQVDAYIIKDNYKLFGDNVFYDKPAGYAKAIGHVVIADTTNKTYAYGDKAEYWDIRKEAEITENPYVMMVDKTDTLYLRSDKMYLRTIKDEKCNTADSVYRLGKAIGNVKFYRNDIQGICDSMIYNTLDSALVMHVEPVLWNEQNQMSANLITVHSGEKTIRQIDFDGSAFVVQKEDSVHFNQMLGKAIYARFIAGKLNRMDVVGNGQAVYYGKENDTIAMVNIAECSNIAIHIKENKVSKIVFLEKPSSNFFPIDLIDPEETVLKGFRWRGSLRPADKYAIIPKTLILFPLEKGKSHRATVLQTGIK